MPQPWGELAARSHELVLGAPGCGKTPYAAARVRDARRVVFFDSAGDWARGGEGERIPAELLAVDDLAGVVVRVCVEPDPANLAADFARTLDLCRAVAPPVAPGLVLVVDEVGDLARVSLDELLWLHRAGHKDGIASILVSACITDIPKRCRDTASRVAVFFQKSADDAATLDREYGNDFGARARAWRHPAPPVVWSSPVLHHHHAPHAGRSTAHAA